MSGQEKEIQARLQMLAGQFDGLLCIVSALIHEAPDIEKLHGKFTESRLRQEATQLPAPVSEHFLEGVNSTYKRIDALLWAAKRRRAAESG